MKCCNHENELGYDKDFKILPRIISDNYIKNFKFDYLKNTCEEIQCH